MGFVHQFVETAPCLAGLLCQFQAVFSLVNHKLVYYVFFGAFLVFTCVQVKLIASKVSKQPCYCQF